MQEQAKALILELAQLRQRATKVSALSVRPVIEEMAEKQEQLNKLFYAQIFGGANG